MKDDDIWDLVLERLAGEGEVFVPPLDGDNRSGTGPSGASPDTGVDEFGFGGGSGSDRSGGNRKDGGEDTRTGLSGGSDGNVDEGPGGDGRDLGKGGFPDNNGGKRGGGPGQRGTPPTVDTRRGGRVDDNDTYIRK